MSNESIKQQLNKN